MERMEKPVFGRVARAVAMLIFMILLIQLLACGAYSTPSMGINTGTTSTVSGAVSSVALTSVNNGMGGLTTATAVTLSVAMGVNSLVLCGDQRSSFTMNSMVQVSTTPGTYCSTLVSVMPA